jgi:CheY-like chemotaxis protein
MLSNTEILEASILVVDDQDANIKLLERLLQGAGYTNVSSTTAPQDVPILQRRSCWTCRCLAWTASR